MSFNCFISSYICLKFPLRCLYDHYLSFKRYSACKIGKKAIDNACFFTFFTTLDLTWPWFWPRTTPNLIFFVGFQLNVLEDSIQINNFNWTPEFLRGISLTYLLNQSINQSVSQSVSQPVSQSASQRVSQSVRQPVS